jgi:xanthine dehydrogenase YagS FAD-binding subunit
MHPFAWLPARSLSEAAGAASITVATAMARRHGAAAGHAVIKAGGIDLLDLLKEGLLAPGMLVNLREVPGLDRIVEEPGGGVCIGSMSTLASLACNPLIRQRYPALAEAAGTSASPQIRNLATLGGNLLQRPRCWYLRAAELRCLRKGGEHCFALSGENRYHAVFNNRPCAIVHPSTAAGVLVALGATLDLSDAAGATRRPTLAAFLQAPPGDATRENSLEPHEVLTAVRLPALAPGTRMAHLKLGEKDAFDWPLAAVTVVLQLAPDDRCTGAAIVLGAAAPAPYRAVAAEQALIGRRVGAAVAIEAARLVSAGATPLAGNAYKLPLFEALTRRAILTAMEQ